MTDPFGETSALFTLPTNADLRITMDEKFALNVERL